MNITRRTSRRLLPLLFIVQTLCGFAPEQHSLAQYEPWVVKIAWSADGNLQAIGYSDYKTIDIRHAVTGQVVRTLEIPHFADIAWSPLAHPELLAICDPDGNIWIFDASASNVVTRVEDHADPQITTVAWSPDGTRLAAGHVMGSEKGESARGIVKVWDSSTGQLLMTLDSTWHLYSVVSVVWSPDGGLIASVDVDRAIIWNAVSGAIETRLGIDGVRRVSWSPDGNRLITGGFSFSVEVWDGNTYQLLSTFDTGDPVIELAWRPDGQQIALLLSEKLRIVDGNTYQTLYDSPRSAYVLHGMAWSPDGSQLAYGGDNGTLEIIDIVLPYSLPHIGNCEAGTDN